MTVCKTALISGVGGQDGSYLAEYLLQEGYKVYGLLRRSSTSNTQRIDHIKDKNFEIVNGDILDASGMMAIVGQIKPTELYHLACQSHVGRSFTEPAHTFQSVAMGTLNVLEAIRQNSPSTKMLQASSSEMFGGAYSLKYTELGVRHSNIADAPFESDLVKECAYQDENTPFCPNSPYAVAKLAAHNLCKVYRQSYGLFIGCAISFNHESERRGTEFVTQKIAKYVATAHKSPSTCGQLKLGNLDAFRDWSHAKDMVVGMYDILHYRNPNDFVLCSGETHSVREFLTEAFAVIGVSDWSNYVTIDQKLIRPLEVPYLCGSSKKAWDLLRWETMIEFKDLAKMMVEAQIKCIM